MFSFRLAIQSIKNEKWINILSVISIATGLFILFSVFMVIYNVEMLSKRLPEKLTVMVYLNDSADEVEINNIEKIIKSHELVKSIRRISKKEALNELKVTLGEAGYILEGIDENPLFSSIDVKLKEGDFPVESVKSFLNELKAVQGISDIEYGGSIMESVYSLKDALRVLGFTVGAVFFFAILFISYSTVKILFYRHKEEIEVFKLLGASKVFIRMPFLFEGLLIGLFGGIFAAMMFFGVYYFIIQRLIMVVPVLSFIDVPLHYIYTLPLFGSVLGLPGAAFAIGKLKY